MIELLNCDCMDYMAGLPDKAFELAIVDPPYGIGRSGKPKSTSKHGGHKGFDDKGWDELPPSGEYFSELLRVSHNQNYLGRKLLPTTFTCF